MRTKYLFGVVTFIFIWSVCLCVTFAQSTKQEIESLRGLKGVGVLVESIKPEAERDGLTRNQLKVAVELEIRKAGIKILTEEESLSIPGSPFLYVNVHAIKDSLGFYVFSLRINLTQRVILISNPSIATYATTWSKGYTGTIGASRLRDLYNLVKDYVDIFINDYLTANPISISPLENQKEKPRDLLKEIGK